MKVYAAHLPLSNGGHGIIKPSKNKPKKELERVYDKINSD
ncbi:hypothetical protein HMPREF3187_00570 [Aerococcus christensenii]|uniref:Uncharacterized protein n=1 Tax=Aerococcus christensenii TaxID=87541 RepID=A0A133Y2W1_9LACT|nr:hypothetical protein HMPREF3187_00570 [Aerococcus christensenii]